MSYSQQRKAGLLAASFVITTLGVSGCQKPPEVAFNPAPPKSTDCHAHTDHNDKHCHENQPPEEKPPLTTTNPPPPIPKPEPPEEKPPIVISNPPMPAPTAK